MPLIIVIVAAARPVTDTDTLIDFAEKCVVEANTVPRGPQPPAPVSGVNECLKVGKRLGVCWRGTSLEPGARVFLTASVCRPRQVYAGRKLYRIPVVGKAAEHVVLDPQIPCLRGRLGNRIILLYYHRLFTRRSTLGMRSVGRPCGPLASSAC